MPVATDLGVLTHHAYAGGSLSTRHLRKESGLLRACSNWRLPLSYIKRDPGLLFLFAYQNIGKMHIVPTSLVTGSVTGHALIRLSRLK